MSERLYDLLDLLSPWNFDILFSFMATISKVTIFKVKMLFVNVTWTFRRLIGIADGHVTIFVEWNLEGHVTFLTVKIAYLQSRNHN